MGMADINATEDQGQATHDGAGTDGTQEQQSGTDERFKALESVDPDVLKRYVDSQTSKAIKTYEGKLKAKQEADKSQAEQRAAEERGEFGKLKQQYEATIGDLKQQLVTKDVQHSLTKHAADLGLIDMDDLSLVVGDAVANAVGDDGGVDDTKVRAVLDEFKKAKPHKFKDANAQEQAPRFRGGPTPAQPQAGQTGPMFGPASTDDYIKARNAGLQKMKSQSKPRGVASQIASEIAKHLNRA